jgi:hypothetical protein
MAVQVKEQTVAHAHPAPSPRAPQAVGPGCRLHKLNILAGPCAATPAFEFQPHSRITFEPQCIADYTPGSHRHITAMTAAALDDTPHGLATDPPHATIPLRAHTGRHTRL